MLESIPAFLIVGVFVVVNVIGIALLLHLQLGLAGIGNFGVVGFWGIGMYAFGVTWVRVDWAFGEPWPFLISLVIGTAVAGLAGLVVGWLIADLDVDGQLVGTLGFATIVVILATTQKDLTGGTFGMGGLDFPYDVGTIKANEITWLGILVLVVAAILYYVSRVHRAPYGRLLIALGANEPLARSLGKRTFATKLWLFAFSSGLMGLLGGLYGVMIHLLSPLEIGVEVTLAAIVGLVLGGSARVWGAVIGVLLTLGLFDVAIQAYAPIPATWSSQALPVLREVLFGAALIVMLIFRPFGVLGDMRRDKLSRRVHGD